mmetsp:Transcript_7137/g.26114  ORF Transcript_7137/g.26114 Transcript_7137/m.26114 type:complete len:203 (+) Transcript_7137:503-1111(+)
MNRILERISHYDAFLAFVFCYYVVCRRRRRGANAILRFIVRRRRPLTRRTLHARLAFFYRTIRHERSFTIALAHPKLCEIILVHHRARRLHARGLNITPRKRRRASRTRCTPVAHPSTRARAPTFAAPSLSLRVIQVRVRLAKLEPVSTQRALKPLARQPARQRSNDNLHPARIAAVVIPAAVAVRARASSARIAIAIARHR